MPSTKGPKRKADDRRRQPAAARFEVAKPGRLRRAASRPSYRHHHANFAVWALSPSLAPAYTDKPTEPARLRTASAPSTSHLYPRVISCALPAPACTYPPMTRPEHRFWPSTAANVSDFLAALTSAKHHQLTARRHCYSLWPGGEEKKKKKGQN